MGEVISFKYGVQNVDEYMELVETAERYIAELRVLRIKRGTVKGDLAKAESILKEIKFCARFSPTFRELSVGELESILDELYVELNEGEP